MISLDIYSKQNVNDNGNPIVGDTILTAVKYYGKKGKKKQLTLLRAYHYHGMPYAIRSLVEAPLVYRLASDKASALQMRRIKSALGLLDDRAIELSHDELTSKIAELLARIISDNIDTLLTGEAS